MIPSIKGTPRKSGLPNWLIFGLLGLAATAGGIFLPASLKHGGDAPEATPSLTGGTPVPPGGTPTAANDSLDYNPPALPDMPSPRAMFMRLGLGTVFVLILSVVTLWAGKRWIRPLAGASGENKQLRIIESLALGRCSLYLVQAGEAKVLAGVDPAGIKALLPLPPSFDGALADLGDKAEAPPAEAA